MIEREAHALGIAGTAEHLALRKKESAVGSSASASGTRRWCRSSSRRARWDKRSATSRISGRA
jgi:hypothetical protein